LRKPVDVVLELNPKKVNNIGDFPTPEHPASAENEHNLTFFDMLPGLIFRYNQKRRSIFNLSLQFSQKRFLQKWINAPIDPDYELVRKEKRTDCP